MSKALFNISRFIAILLSIIYTFVLIDSYALRVIVELFGMFIFLCVLHFYERKFKIFSITMFFYVIICFFAMFFCPYIYTNEKLGELAARRPEGSVTPSDHFEIYAIVFFILSVLFLIYIAYSKYQHKEEPYEIKAINSRKKLYQYTQAITFSKHQDMCVFFTMIVLIMPLFYYVGGESRVTIGVASFTYFALKVIFDRKNINLYSILGLLFSFCFFVLNIFSSRFMLIKYVFPVVLGIIFYFCLYPKKMKPITAYFLCFIGVLAILLYGIVSEVIKLNSLGGTYNIIDIMFDFKSNLKFLHNQIYRIFEIWTPLGGNIIELVEKEGFYYGITYVKFLAPYLGFPYINLAKISAEYIMASYAQPGLVAEGYANFGIFGAVLNLAIVLILTEYMFRRFMKNKNPLNLCLMLTPFTAILLDGGTVNDIILNIVFIFVTLGLSYVTREDNLKFRKMETIGRNK